MNKFITILAILLLALNASAQKIQKGVVISREDKTLISNATISGVKSGNTVISDRNGAFALPVNDHDTIIIRHVGYQPLHIGVVSDPDSLLTVLLESKKPDLEPVLINTGYQSIPKERSTGSFTQINKDRYNEQLHVDVLDGIQYITNGLTSRPIGSIDPIVIRGVSSFSSNLSSPLIILDNFPYEGDLSNLNPEDVENITVLKDAAAASIWGAKAGNGVIVITTKKGRYNRPLSVTASAKFSVTDKPDLFYSRNISTSDYIDIEQMLFNKGYYDNKLTSPNWYPLTPVVNILAQEKSGTITHQDAITEINALRSTDSRQQWLDHIYSQGINHQYGVTLNGGSNKFNWILSTGYNRNLDNLRSIKDRINLHWNNTYMVFKNLSVSTNIFYTESKNKSGKPGFGTITTNSGNLPPYTKLMDSNGNPLPVFTKFRQVYVDSVGGGRLLDWNYYPFSDYLYENNITRSQDFNAEVGINYKVREWLHLSLKYRYEKQQQKDDNLHTTNSFYTRDLINNYSQFDPESDEIKYIIPNGDILDIAYNDIQAQNFRAQVSVDKQWQHHTISGIAGTEVSETINQGNSYRTYDYDPDILTYTNVDYANTYPTQIFGSNAFIPNPQSFSKRNNRFVSYFTNIAYNYANKYTITASARRDASNLFGVSINNKWKPLWSLGGAWDISKENFYRVDWLPELKLRITYGHQGNIDPTQAAVTTINYTSNSPYTKTPMARINNYPNPDLKWEQVGMMNIGLDFQTKSRRLSGSIEYYNKRMTDLFGEYPIETTTGLHTRNLVKNVGIMRGNGLDIELKSINLTGILGWSTDFIFNTYKDKVTKSSRKSSNLSVDNVTGGGKLLMEGYPLWGLFAYKWAGLNPETGNPRGYLEGNLSEDYNALTGPEAKVSDLVYKGSGIPTLFGSLGNKFTWKKLSLVFRITYKLKYNFFRNSINYNNLFGTGVSAGSIDYTRRWKKPGDEKNTNIPSFVYPTNSSRDLFYSGSEVLVTRGDHIRLQYINLTYQFKPKTGSPIKDIKLSVSANNIGILWRANKEEIDPDYEDQGIPAPRSINIGLNLSF